jgi:hypothetical protein
MKSIKQARRRIFPLKINTRFITVVLILIGSLAAGSPAAAARPGQAPSVLKSVGFLKVENGLEVSIGIDGDFQYQPLVLSNPARLVIDITNAQRIESQAYYEVNELGLTGVRTGRFSPSVARVVFDFSGPIPIYEITQTSGGLSVKFSAGAAAKPEKAEIPVEAKPVVKEPVKEVVPVKTEEKPEAKAAVKPAAERTEPGGFRNTTLGFTLSSYQIPDQVFKEVYGDEAQLTYGLNLSRTLLRYEGLQLDVSGEIRFYSKSGVSTLDQTPTKFSMTPISLAGRLLYQTPYIIPFVGVGPDWYSYKEESDLVPGGKITGNASGWHYQVGVYFVVPTLDFLRLKLYYKFTKVKALQNDFNVDLGGNEYGIGLSFGFNILNKGVITF